MRNCHPIAAFVAGRLACLGKTPFIAAGRQRDVRAIGRNLRVVIAMTAFIIRRLGQGGMARVFLASDESLHRDVAIKVLADRHADDPHFIERFQREARAAARLNHPNIVQVYDQSQGGMAFIVQEYVEGETLKDLIRRESPLDPRQIGRAHV